MAEINNRVGIDYDTALRQINAMGAPAGGATPVVEAPPPAPAKDSRSSAIEALGSKIGTNYQKLDAALQKTPEAMPDLPALVAGIRRSGRLPMAEFGRRAADALVDEAAPMLLRWALDLFGPRVVVELQVDDEYLFDPPPKAFGTEVVDVLTALHVQGVRRILYRDVNPAAEPPLSRLQELGDRVPIRLIRDGDLEAIGPEIVGAARAFAAGG